MANVFAILTAIVLAVSAFLAVKNYQAYSSDDPASPGIIQERQREEQIRDRQTKDLAELRATLKQTNEDRLGTEETAAERQVTLDEKEAKNKGLEEQIGEDQRKIAANKQKIDDMENRLAETGDIETLVADLQRDQADIERLGAGIAENEATLANLTAEIRRTDAVIADFRGKERSHANKESYFQQARIRSVFGNWGFVTIGAGNSAGVVQDSMLNVMRDGEVIAKLLVTAVEASSAAADIIPDSLQEDTVLMTGDLVVPAPREAREPAPAPAAAPEPGAPPAPMPDGEPADGDPADGDPADEGPAAEAPGDAPAADAGFDDDPF